MTQLYSEYSLVVRITNEFSLGESHKHLCSQSLEHDAMSQE